MKNMDDIRLLLYRSFDEQLTEQEQKMLEKAVLSSKELRTEKEEIELMRQQLSEWQPETESSVTEKVMLRIEREETVTVQYYNLFKKILLSGVAAVILLLLAIWLTDGTLSYDTITGVAGYQPETEIMFPLIN